MPRGTAWRGDRGILRSLTSVSEATWHEESDRRPPANWPRTRPPVTRKTNNMFRARRPTRARKCNSALHKMEGMRKRPPDHTDLVYRDAVSRLRYLLAESYQPACKYIGPPLRIEETEDDGVYAVERSRPILRQASPGYAGRRTVYLGSPLKFSLSPSRSVTFAVPPTRDALPAPALSEPVLSPTHSAPAPAITEQPPPAARQPPGELMNFIERQEEYIDHLEKESQYCRDELSNLMGKVKDLITENEDLHDAHKTTLIRSGTENSEEDEDVNHNISDTKVSRHRSTPIEGPSIVFESRISELEAQLTQARMLQRKAQDEAEVLRRQLSDGHGSIAAATPLVEALQKERDELARTVAKLQDSLAQFREKEADATSKVKRSLNVVDQAQFEKTQAETEVRRLRDELERQHEKLREVLHDQSRRVQEAERRYGAQVEQLTADLASQWDVTSRLQLEVDKQRRVEAELRREITQKNNLVEDMRKELNAKIGSLQTELLSAAASKGSAEQELSEARLSNERAERTARQEIAKLQTEIAALRQRLDRADAESLHSRKENLRLMEQISSLEKEINLSKMLKENRDVPVTKHDPERQKELTSMLLDMDAKQAQTVAELENMIQSQNRVMEKLRKECENLTGRLEDSTARNKKEMEGLQSNLNYLSNKLGSQDGPEWRGDDQSRHNQPNQQASQPVKSSDKYDNVTPTPKYPDAAEPERPSENIQRPADTYYEDKSRPIQPEYNRNQYADSRQPYSEPKAEPSYDDSVYTRQGETHYNNPESQEYVPERDYQATKQNTASDKDRGSYDTHNNPPSQGYMDSSYGYETEPSGGGYQSEQYQQPYTEQGYQQPEQESARPDQNMGYSNVAGRGYGEEDMGQKYESSEQSGVPRPRFEEDQSLPYYGQDRPAPMQDMERRMSVAPDQQRVPLQQPAYSAGGNRAPEMSKPPYNRTEPS